VCSVIARFNRSFHRKCLPNLPQFGSGVNLGSFVQADVNNDGQADIIGFASPTTTEPNFQIVVLLGNGTGGFGAPVITTITAVNPILISPEEEDVEPFVFGDFNDDGKTDAAVFGKDKVGQLAVAVMLGNGDGTFQSAKETILSSSVGQPATQSCSCITGDYNGDGKLDLASRISTSTVTSILLSPTAPRNRSTCSLAMARANSRHEPSTG
jgi:hypothetical protein